MKKINILAFIVLSFLLFFALFQQENRPLPPPLNPPKLSEQAPLEEEAPEEEPLLSTAIETPVENETKNLSQPPQETLSKSTVLEEDLPPEEEGINNDIEDPPQYTGKKSYSLLKNKAIPLSGDSENVLKVKKLLRETIISTPADLRLTHLEMLEHFGISANLKIEMDSQVQEILKKTRISMQVYSQRPLEKELVSLLFHKGLTYEVREDSIHIVKSNKSKIH
jgi:hypothetical protein